MNPSCPNSSARPGLVYLATAVVCLLIPIMPATADDKPAAATKPADAAQPADAAEAGQPAEDAPPATLIVVVGAGGTEQYAKAFRQWADRWKQAARQGGAKHYEIGRQQPEATDREQLQSLLGEVSRQPTDSLWLVLIGHGTAYRDVAKFNLRGRDVSAAELGEWLKPLSCRQAIVNCSSSSGPFIKALAADNRIVLTATRNGSEQNYARFGDYLSRAITDDEADLDHDGQTSLLEAYLSSVAATVRFYKNDSRLVTEHALLDDNGDGLGTPADFFRGIRAVRSAQGGAALDGRRAHQWHLVAGKDTVRLNGEQKKQRDELERRIDLLRGSKSQLTEDEYYQQLEPLLVQFARLSAESSSGKSSPGDEER